MLPPARPHDIRLEPLTRDDFDRVRPWIDPRIFRIFRHPVDDEQLERLLTRHEGGRPVSLGYRAVHPEDPSILGLVHAVLDWRNDLAHVGQIVVDPPQRNRGLGTEILRQIFRICFVDHGLHRVQLFVDVDNAAAIASYEKAGLRREGVMREAASTEDGYVSWCSMSILDREWRATASP